ncbi:MAG: amidase family protein, partial [Thermaerobacterales bacterium]
MDRQDVSSLSAKIPAGDEMENFIEATISDLQKAMGNGDLTARALVEMYLSRIEALDRGDRGVGSVLEINPDCREIAGALDRERRDGHLRGPLHGIPILLKDNINTGDRMQTTAGSMALAGSPAPADAPVAANLRIAGAVILGKANLSEWANFRSTHSTSGWSALGGFTRNPYALRRNPSGSSAGSAAAVAANFVAAALGTETNGSIVSPANACGVVGVKPTVGLTSRSGVVPIAHSQDTVGTHTRTVTDAAVVLGALVGVDPDDAASPRSEDRYHRDYTVFLYP